MPGWNDRLTFNHPLNTEPPKMAVDYFYDWCLCCQLFFHSGNAAVSNIKLLGNGVDALTLL